MKRDVAAVRRLASSIVVLASAMGCARTEKGTLAVYAAASLRETLSTIATAFEHEEGVRVELSFGPSSFLAAQIRAGAPACVFVSADERQMDAVVKAGLLEPDSRFDLLSNRLAIVERADAPRRLLAPEDLARPDIERIAIADPSGVPAGVYALEFLSRAGLRDRIGSRLLSCNDVRGALAAVEAGEADCGIVYRTDAAISRRVRIAFEVPDQFCPSIRYPAAQIHGCANSHAAEQFLRFLRGKTATRVFAAAGFVLPA